MVNVKLLKLIILQLADNHPVTYILHTLCNLCRQENILLPLISFFGKHENFLYEMDPYQQSRFCVACL